DISGLGQTEAAHQLCVNIPSDRKAHWMQPSVGHYGVFNGSRFRAEIAPRIADFVLSVNGVRGSNKRLVSSMNGTAAKKNGAAHHPESGAPAEGRAAAE